SIEVAPVDMAADVARQRVLGPFPLSKGPGIKFEFTRGRIESAQRFPIDHNTDYLLSGGGLFYNLSGLFIDASAGNLSFRQPGLVLIIHCCLDAKRAITSHIIKRLETRAG